VASAGEAVQDDLCFCCGTDNDRGLKLKFTYDGQGGAETSVKIPEWFSGWRRMTHGGLLSMLLDESMAHACIGLYGNAITAELTVRYHAPVEVGTVVSVRATAGKVRARIIDTTGTIIDSSGKEIATGRARFFLAKLPKGTSKNPPLIM
jgi:acyl-coenzyme A thioesterase PaaI-like protein